MAVQTTKRRRRLQANLMHGQRTPMTRIRWQSLETSHVSFLTMRIRTGSYLMTEGDDLDANWYIEFVECDNRSPQVVGNARHRYDDTEWGQYASTLLGDRSLLTSPPPGPNHGSRHWHCTARYFFLSLLARRCNLAHGSRDPPVCQATGDRVFLAVL